MSKKSKTFEEKAKQGFESTYQADKLRAAVKKGLSARSIMDALGIKSKQVLKQHLLKLIQEDKGFYEISGLYEKGGRTIRATPKCELKIGSSVLRAQGLDIHPGTEFHLTIDGDSIILSKVNRDNAPADNDLESPLVDDFANDVGGDEAPSAEIQS